MSDGWRMLEGQDGPSQMRDPAWAAPPSPPALSSENGGKGHQPSPVIFGKSAEEAAPSGWM